MKPKQDEYYKAESPKEKDEYYTEAQCLKVLYSPVNSHSPQEDCLSLDPPSSQEYLFKEEDVCIGHVEVVIDPAPLEEKEGVNYILKWVKGSGLATLRARTKRCNKRLKRLGLKR